jgi:hypothetical protein
MIDGGHGFRIHTLEAQGVIIKLNENTDLPLPETWTERPVLELCGGTIASPGLTRIATGRKPNEGPPTDPMDFLTVSPIQRMLDL